MIADPIHKFILTNKQNLRIASNVFEVWPEVRKQIAVSFIGRLENRLKKSVRGWEFECWGQFYDDIWPCFMFWKPLWQGNYYVILQFGEYGRRMSFGISRDEHLKSISKRPRCAEVLNTIKNIHPSAVGQTWWEAKIFMSFPAADWQKPDVLWQMHNDKPFLEDVAEQLLEVAKISEPIIDKLVRKYKK